MGAYWSSARRLLRDDEDILGTLQAYFRVHHASDGKLFDSVFHHHARLPIIRSDGHLSFRDTDTLRAEVQAREPSSGSGFASYDRVLSLNMVDERTAVAKLQLVLPAPPGLPAPSLAPVRSTALAVLLNERGRGWRITSKVEVGAPLEVGPGDSAARDSVQRRDVAEVADVVWQYVAAHRAADATAMRGVYHPLATATFSLGQRVHIDDADTFYEQVGRRWSLPDHAPYAHLAEEPRTAACDSILSIDFVGQGACVCTCRVGLPPWVYTDVLSILYLPALVLDASRESGRAGWWIVANSRAIAPFLAAESAPSDSTAGR